MSQIADATRASLPTVSPRRESSETVGLVTVRMLVGPVWCKPRLIIRVGQAMRQLIPGNLWSCSGAPGYFAGWVFPILRVPLFMARGLAVVLGWLGTCRTILKVLVVGSLHGRSCMRAIDDAEQKLGYEVNVKRLSPEAWNSQDGCADCAVASYVRFSLGSWR